MRQRVKIMAYYYDYVQPSLSGNFPSLVCCAAVHGVGMSGAVFEAVSFVFAGAAGVIFVHLLAMGPAIPMRQCHWQEDHMPWASLPGWL